MWFRVIYFKIIVARSQAENYTSLNLPYPILKKAFIFILLDTLNARYLFAVETRIYRCLFSAILISYLDTHCALLCAIERLLLQKLYIFLRFTFWSYIADIVFVTLYFIENV